MSGTVSRAVSAVAAGLIVFHASGCSMATGLQVDDELVGARARWNSQRIVAGVVSQAEEISVSFNEELGYPESTDIKYVSRFVDDDLTVRVNSFTR